MWRMKLSASIQNSSAPSAASIHSARITWRSNRV